MADKRMNNPGVNPHILVRGIVQVRVLSEMFYKVIDETDLCN